jgi:hypothetical protein
MVASFQGFGGGSKAFAALLLAVMLTLIVACATPVDSPAFQLAQSAKLASEPEPASGKTAQDERLFYIDPEAMDTGAACCTYNVFLAEDRRVPAALLPPA